MPRFKILANRNINTLRFAVHVQKRRGLGLSEQLGEWLINIPFAQYLKLVKTVIVINFYWVIYTVEEAPNVPIFNGNIKQ